MKRARLQPDLARRIQAALPQVKRWIDDYVAANAGRARAIGSLGFARLAEYFPADMLSRARVVSVDRVPFPPLEQFGVPELAPMQQLRFDGVTYKDTIFVQGRAVEGLCFHELVHVVQWGRLGVDNFLLAYGLGLILAGYSTSPLEVIAYNLQREFERGRPLPGLVRTIEDNTDLIWKQAGAMLGGLR